MNDKRIWDPSLYSRLSPCHSSCSACPLHLEAPTTVGVPSVYCLDSQARTPNTPPFVVVGQNPGRSEDRQGFPFVGATGHDLHRVILRYLGIKQTHSVYLLNAYRCFHAAGSPKPAYVARCAPHLSSDLQTITNAHREAPSKFILCLGQPAWSAFARRLGVPASLENHLFGHQDTRFQVTDSNNQPHTWRIYGTYHPAFIMRQRSAIKAMSDHLRLLRDALDGIIPEPSSPTIILPRLPFRSDS